LDPKELPVLRERRVLKGSPEPKESRGSPGSLAFKDLKGLRVTKEFKV